MDRVKQLTTKESDKVARHRNMMHDIALKKQINVIQREGRILERELREITKVKQTLMQLRDPIRRRVMQHENIDEEEVAHIQKKASVLYGLPRQTVSRQGRASAANKQTNSQNKLNDLMDIKGLANKSKNNQQKTTDVLPNRNCKKGFSSARKTPEKNNFLSFPTINDHSKTCATNSERCTLVNNFTRPDTSLTPGTVRRRSLTVPQSPKTSFGQKKYKEDGKNINNNGKQDDRRPETSMTGALRRRSVTVPQPPATSLGHRARNEDNNPANTLTMEETLRIKGKFRQIGHSIIATALLKGLRQRGTLSSEAIHNMHKPIAVAQTTNDEPNTAEQEGDEEKPKSGLNNFRKLTRKAINVNTVIGLKTRNTTNQVTTRIEQGSTEQAKPPPPRKLGIAGVAHAVKLSRALEQSESRGQLMNTHTQNRRRKIGIAGIAHAAMITKAFSNQHNEDPKEEKTVRFKVDEWE